MLESKAYKTYYAFASGEKTPKLKCVRKKADSNTSPKQKPVQATKGIKVKIKAKVAKSDKKKQHAKMPKSKGLAVLSKVALTKAEQLKLATKKSKTQFHSSHASDSGDGFDTQSNVPDEQHLKTTGVDEGTEEDEDDENDSEDKSDGNDDDDDDANDDDNQEGDDTNDDDKETDSDRTESDRIKILVLNQSSTELYEEEEEKINDEEMIDEEDDDEVTKELYDDVNVNLGNEDADMTNADQGAPEQQNASQESGFEQLLNLENSSPADNEIASLIETSARYAMAIPKITSGFTTTIPLTPPFFNHLPPQATPTPTPTNFEDTTSFTSLLDFSSVFKFNDRVTNLEKDLLEINHVDQYAQALSSIPTIVDRYINNKLGEAINKAIQAHNLDCRQEAQDEKNAYIELILPQAVSDFANPVIEKNVIESLEAAVLTRSSSQPKSTYEAAASFSEFELTKILLDKMEERKSHLRDDYKKKLYDALVESYNTDKDLFTSYGEVFTLTRSRDDNDKDRDPSAGSDQGTKRRKSSKEAESSKDSRSKEKKSSSTSKDASQSQHKSSGNSAHTEEPTDWFKKPQRPLTPDTDWNKRQQADFRPPQTWISQVARTKEPRTLFDELMDISFDFSAFVLNRLNIKDLTQEILAITKRLDWHNPEGKPYPFDLSKPLLLIQDHRGRQVIPPDFFINNDMEYLKGGDLSRRYSTSVTKTKTATYEIKWIEELGFAGNMSSSKDVYSKKRIITVTRLTIMKKYDYGHLEEIEVRREDQKLYKFREGDFPRLRLQGIEDMLLQLVQKKLTNLIIDERYDLNVALHMFTRRIVIQRQVEDLQLGVKSYQKKLNLTKPDTFRSNLRNRTTYTAYSDPKGVIYKDQMNRNRLMRADELYKFSDGTLDDVRSALNDIAKRIRMEYFPKRKWCDLDKRRARVMIQDIDKKLFERRLM
ncbi:hypothetical protein Tco_0898183 [Tanacetum coccineum]